MDISNRWTEFRIYEQLVYSKERKKRKENGQVAWTSTSQMKTSRWPINIWKLIHYVSEKSKLMLLWESTTHSSEWLKLRNTDNSVMVGA